MIDLKFSSLIIFSLFASPMALPATCKTPDEIALLAEQNCFNQGILLNVKNYVYLKLNEQYLEKVFNELKEIEPDIQIPHFLGNIGPHISVIRDDEWKETPSEAIPELGHQYLFHPLRCELVHTAKGEWLWVLVVEPSAELASIREKYATGPLPHGHEFHITIAQK